MKKSRCVHCRQIYDSSIQQSFFDLRPCNAPDGDGHLWEYNKAYKLKFTEKFPFQYIIQVSGYSVMTIDEEKWTWLQNKLDDEELFTFPAAMIPKLEMMGFAVTKRYIG